MRWNIFRSRNAVAFFVIIDFYGHEFAYINTTSSKEFHLISGGTETQKLKTTIIKNSVIENKVWIFDKNINLTYHLPKGNRLNICLKRTQKNLTGYQKTSKIEIESDISSSPDPIPILKSCGFKNFLTDQIVFKITKHN